MKIARCIAAAALAGTAALVHAQAAEPSPDEWQFRVEPYLWLPNIDGTLRFSVPPGTDGSPSVEVRNNYLENLDFALVVAGEVRKGAWAIFTDLIYLDFSGESASVKSIIGPGGIVEVPADVNSESGLKSTVWELAGSYAISQSDTTPFDVFGGFRYVGVEGSVDWQLAGPIGLFPDSGSFSQDKDLWDAIVGVRGKVRFGGGDWFVPYYLDAGTGSSDLTWQALAGIGYTFKWGDLRFAYRHLSIDQGSDKLLQDMRFSGPAFGASFRF
jgi:hypothetical protein